MVFPKLANHARYGRFDRSSREAFSQSRLKIMHGVLLKLIVCKNMPHSPRVFLIGFALLSVFMTTSSCMNPMEELTERDRYSQYTNVGGQGAVCKDPATMKSCEAILKSDYR